MPKPKLSKKERKIFSEQKRREKLRNNPVLCEEYLRKERERYVKKKAARVVVLSKCDDCSKASESLLKKLNGCPCLLKKRQQFFVRTHLKMLV